MNDVVLEAKNLSCGYGRMSVVRELDLPVMAGEVAALIGPNGAGKTTTLLTLAGELRHHSDEGDFAFTCHAEVEFEHADNRLDGDDLEQLHARIVDDRRQL